MVTSLLNERSDGSPRQPTYGGFRRLAYGLTALLLGLSSGLTAAQAQTTTLTYTGAAQTYTVPAGITRLQVTARGAGVSTSGAPVTSSLGAVVEATIIVTPNEVLNVFVGGTTQGYTGGYNGGGAGGVGAGGFAFYPSSALGGGGATDIRRGGTTLAARILVAGGGGGAGMWGSNAGGSFPGGAGGSSGQTGSDGISGGTPHIAGGGATQSAGGSGGGTLGQGGSGSGGGGGGGYYGGGAGSGSAAQATGGAGGGGGSSYVAPASVAAGTTPSYSSASTGAGSIVLTPVIPTPAISSFAPGAGPVGTTVTITGTDFSGATAVSFNGTAATLSVTNATTISATVPTGATTGPIAVTTPGGTATSASSFGVLTAGPATTISYTGAPQTYTVPAGVTRLQVAAQGAGSGQALGPGRGALVTATLSVVPGEVLTLVVGGGPAPNGTQPGAGGYNGGGAGGNPSSTPSGSVGNNPGGGGAGATDVRRIVGASNASPLAGGTLTSTLSRRLLVAGGAGGAGTDAGATGFGNNNAGGGAPGTAFGGGTGGTYSGFPAAAGAAGSLGQGGQGGNGTVGGGGYGGGGGYYGGGGGSGTVSITQQWAAGGGGSSYVDPAAVTSSSTPTYALAAASSPGTLTLTPLYDSPTLTSFSPASGPAGTSVVLTGTNLAGTTGVSFNGTAATSFTVNSATSITATVPSGASTGTIRVTTPGGSATSASSFTVTAPTPTISGFTPTSGPVGTSVRINGTNLGGATAVTFNGTAAAGFVADTAGTSLTVSVPSGATTGSIAVTTIRGTATSATSFTVTAAAPTITSLTPASGPITAPVDISGTNLIGATSVTFTGNGGPVQAGIALNSAGLIRVNVPAGAITGPVRVTTPGGTAVSPGNYTVQPNPVVYSLTPASGPVGTQVVIAGENFTGALLVSFNQTFVSAQNFTVNSPTQITVNVPAGATTGPVGVNTGGATAFSPSPFTVTVAPTNLTVSSAQNISGAYQNVTITGTGTATLTGQLKVAGTLTVQSGGTLLTSCQPLRGTGSFELQAGATLGICDAAGIRASSTDTTGAIRLTGSRSFSPDATYLYNGAVAQVIGSGLPATVRDLTINNAAGLALSQPLALSRVLTLTSGRLNTTGQPLTLLSNASGTAVVVNVGGDVAGNVTVQRYISPALNAGTGYRHLASPVQNTSVADLAVGSFSPVVNPAYNSSATPNLVTPFPTVFGYDQARQTSSPATSYNTFDKGWFSPLSPADALQVGRGYTVNLAGGLTPDFVGTLNNGPQTLNFTRTTGPEAGWQLVGNPYPSPLDWRLVARADRSGLSGAVYVYESTSAYQGRYRSYVNGIGNPVLPLGQAFFVRVADSSSTGTLIFRNSQRLTTPDATPLLRGTPDLRPQLQLSLRGASTRDDAYVYAEAGATAGVEAEFDAHKLPNATGLNLAVLAGTTPLAIAGVAPFATTTVLPLQVQVPAPGAYSLQAEQLLNLPTGTAVYLHDAQTGANQLLTPQSGYPFTLTSTSVGSRFSLVFRPGSVTATANAQQPAQLMVFPNPTTNTFTLHLAAATPGQTATAVLYNALGQAVYQQVVAGGAAGLRGEFSVAQLPAGVYTLRLTLANGTQLTKRVIKQ